MSVGMVYMRPLRLAGISAVGEPHEQAEKSWTALNDWIVRKGFAREIEIGYGLFQQSPDGPQYFACIELPVTATKSETAELRQVNLDGGAHFRRRYNGPFSEIPSEFNSMQRELSTDNKLCQDQSRPLLTIFLELKKFQLTGDIRSNMLIPVGVVDIPGSSPRAA